MLINFLKPSTRQPYYFKQQRHHLALTPPSNSHHQDYYIISRESLSTFIPDTYWVGVEPNTSPPKNFHQKCPPGSTTSMTLLRHSCHGSPIRMTMLQIGGRNMEAVQHLAILHYDTPTDLMGLNSILEMSWTTKNCKPLGIIKTQYLKFDIQFNLVLIHAYSPSLGNRTAFLPDFQSKSIQGSVFAHLSSKIRCHICINEAI